MCKNVYAMYIPFQLSFYFPYHRWWLGMCRIIHVPPWHHPLDDVRRRLEHSPPVLVLVLIVVLVALVEVGAGLSGQPRQVAVLVAGAGGRPRPALAKGAVDGVDGGGGRAGRPGDVAAVVVLVVVGVHVGRGRGRGRGEQGGVVVGVVAGDREAGQENRKRKNGVRKLGKK